MGPTTGTLAGRFEATAALYAEHWAVKTPRHQWTWRQLHNQAEAVAMRLLEAGADRQAPVAIVMETDAPILGAMLGVLKAGLFLVVIDPSHPLERNRVLVEDSLAHVVITDAASVELARALNPHWRIVISPDLNADLSLGATSAAGRFQAPWPRSPDDLCFLIYTSGSTGRPKGVMCGNRMALAYGAAVCDGIEMTSADRITLLHSPSVAGAWRHIVSAVMSGACLYPYRISQHGLVELSELLVREEITVLHSIASIMRHFDESLAPEVVFPKLRAVVFGGERVFRGDVLAARRRAAPGAGVLLGLGSSETGTISRLLLRPDMPLEGDIAPIGRPLEGKHVSILDEEGRAVPDGEIGEFVVSSPDLSTGYWRQPELTAQQFHVEPNSPGMRRFHTKDMGYRSSDGTLWHTGRKDFQVKIRGFRIDVSEIEAALASHPHVLDCAVFAKPDERGEEALAAYVALRSGCRFDEQDLRLHVGQRLPIHMVPSRFENPIPWPVTPGGKVDRPALARAALSSRVETPNHQAGTNGFAHRDDVESKLEVLWRQVLGRNHIGPQDDFFALGGHSLKAAQLFAKVHNTFGFAPPLSILMRGATLSHLAAAIRQGHQRSEAPLLHELKPTGSRPPLFIVHGIGGEVLSYRPMIPYLDPEQPLIGLQASRFVNEQAALPHLTELARMYVAAVRLRQPHGPYFLAGYSAGGHTAFEMARQLKEQGEQVALLAIVDGVAHYHARWKSVSPGRFLKNLYWLIQEDFTRSGIQHLSRRTYRKLSAWTRRGGRPSAENRHGGSRLDQFFDTASLPPRWLRFMEQHEQAIFNHRHRPYDGPVTVIRCRARGLFSDHSHDLGWGELARGVVDVRTIPGNHDSIMREPDVQHLAQALSAALHAAPAFCDK